MGGSGIKGGFGSFLLRRAAPKSVRQKHMTGPQFNKRKFFHFPKGTHQLHKRVAPAAVARSSMELEHERYRHLPGDLRTRPLYDFTRSGAPSPEEELLAWAEKEGVPFRDASRRDTHGSSSSSSSGGDVNGAQRLRHASGSDKLFKRKDKALFAWQKQGRLQLYQMGGKKEVFVCYRCGYPVKSAMVAIKDDNWDWRMCYNCYTKVRSQGMENNT